MTKLEKKDKTLPDPRILGFREWTWTDTGKQLMDTNGSGQKMIDTDGRGHRKCTSLVHTV